MSESLPANYYADYSPDAQLARIRTAPQIVCWMTQTMDCWVLGSRAAFSDIRIHAKSDWDIMVPFAQWEAVVGALPLDRVVSTKRGGWRFTTPTKTDGDVVVDVWPGDLMKYLTRQTVHVAWHPSTRTIIERRTP